MADSGSWKLKYHEHRTGDEHQHQVSQVLDRFAISDEAYHELSSPTLDLLPPHHTEQLSRLVSTLYMSTSVLHLYIIMLKNCVTWQQLIAQLECRFTKAFGVVLYIFFLRLQLSVSLTAYAQQVTAYRCHWMSIIKVSDIIPWELSVY